MYFQDSFWVLEWYQPILKTPGTGHAGTFCWSTTFGASNDLIVQPDLFCFFFVFRKDPLELSQIPMAYHHFPLRFDKHKLG